MKRPLSILLLSLVTCLVMSLEVQACKYTVRDVAFVDLGESPYQLFVFTKGGESDALKAAMKTAANNVLADANLDAYVADLTKEPDHPAAKYAKAAGVTTFPAAVLIHPDDRTMLLPWKISAKTTAEQLQPLLETLVRSKRRSEIFEHALEAHSILLVIDGHDAAVNKETLQLATDFIPIVEDAMDSMPKPMKRPPHLIHFTREEAEQEKFLLWSLNVDLSDQAPAQVAIVFGRGRQLGPVLRFPEDTRRKFEGSLAVVGKDCECGLDRSWMQGQMIPHVWDSESEAVAMKKLGFDPGNPIVKTEIDRIITRGPGSADGNRAGGESNTVFPALSYQEIELDGDDDDDNDEATSTVAQLTLSQDSQLETSNSDTKQTPSTPASDEAAVNQPASSAAPEEPPLPAATSRGLLVLGSVAAVVVLGIGFVIMLASRRSTT